MTSVADLIVAIPARDEEDLLPACLRSVLCARQRLLRCRPDVRVHVVVALDGCTDGTAAVAATAGVAAVHLPPSGVGRARDAAIRRGLDHLGPASDTSTWIACTDADTIVPDQWLDHQATLASGGIDMVLGTVEPSGLRSPDFDRWCQHHVLRDGHRHIHGANLGLRASNWRRAGGFGPLDVDEDVGLVRAVQRQTARWLSTDAIRVRTSGRLTGRVERGFSGYLRSLYAGSE